MLPFVSLGLLPGLMSLAREAGQLRLGSFVHVHVTADAAHLGAKGFE